MLKSTDAGILEAVLPAATSRSLGALLLFKRNDTWKTVGADARRTFDLDDPAVLKRWEKSLASRIYKVYGYHENPTLPGNFSPCSNSATSKTGSNYKKTSTHPASVPTTPGTS